MYGEIDVKECLDNLVVAMRVYSNYRYSVTEPSPELPTDQKTTLYFTLYEVADHCGCHYNTARRMMNGLSAPPTLRRFKIERTSKLVERNLSLGINGIS
jgi:hypothetical protein